MLFKTPKSGFNFYTKIHYFPKTDWEFHLYTSQALVTEMYSPMCRTQKSMIVLKLSYQKKTPRTEPKPLAVPTSVKAVIIYVG